MAKSKTVKVKALVNLKYDKECKTIGEELDIRIEDTEEMVDKGYVESLEEIPAENGEGEPPKEGE